MQLGPVAEDLHPISEATLERGGHPALPAGTTALPRSLPLRRFEGGERSMVRLRGTRPPLRPRAALLWQPPWRHVGDGGWPHQRIVAGDLPEKAA